MRQRNLDVRCGLRRLGLGVAVTALASVATWGARGSQTPEPVVQVRRSVFLMGTVASFVVESPVRARAVATLERMVRAVEAVEAELSTWRDDSALGRLNRRPIGMALRLPDTTCAWLEAAARWHRVTGGAFDPAVGHLIALWDLRGAGRIPLPAEVEAARARAGFEHVLIGGPPCMVTRSRDVRLDAGAFGKGAALDRVRATIDAGRGAWLIDFGGHIAVSGPPRAGVWRFAIAHPDARTDPFVELEIASGSVATSGGSERDRFVGGTRLGHIVDPRTGQPVTRPGSVSVWHRDALAADALATALHVMGPDDGLQWAERHGVAAYFLTVDDDAGTVVGQPTAVFRRRFPDLARGGVQRRSTGAAHARPRGRRPRRDTTLRLRALE